MTPEQVRAIIQRLRDELNAIPTSDRTVRRGRTVVNSPRVTEINKQISALSTALIKRGAENDASYKERLKKEVDKLGLGSSETAAPATTSTVADDTAAPSDVNTPNPVLSRPVAPDYIRDYIPTARETPDSVMQYISTQLRKRRAREDKVASERRKFNELQNSDFDRSSDNSEFNRLLSWLNNIFEYTNVNKVNEELSRWLDDGGRELLTGNKRAAFEVRSRVGKKTLEFLRYEKTQR